MLSKTKITIVLLLLTQLVFGIDILCRTCTPDGVEYTLQSTASFRAYVRGDCLQGNSVTTADGRAVFEDEGGSTFKASGNGWWRSCTNWSEERPCCAIII